MPSVDIYYLLGLVIPIVFFNFYRPGKKEYKILFLLFADVFLFLLGTCLVSRNNLIKQPSFYGNLARTDTVVTFIASVNDVPVEKERSVKCELRLMEVKSGKGFKKANGTLLTYFRKSKAVSGIKPGQVLMVKADLIEPESPKNPFVFDYRNYLFNKQIYHTAFVDSVSFATLPLKSSLNSIWLFGLRCKEFLLMRLENSGLSKNAYSICAALLSGYDDEIDRSVMEAFSHSGTLHVLSVSGLHTGLIYLALNFLFNYIDRKKKYKLARFIFITVFLWFFALITGFCAPVLRAVIMFNLLGFGKIYFRAKYSHQLNILLVSAFILLLYNPFYVTDVGFLLSYFALFGLLYFQPKLSACWQPDSKILGYGWQSLTASVAATLSTLPITLFYFKQFPLWFFVCNIVVVPATFLLLILAVLVVFKVNLVTIVVNYLVAVLIWFINLFNSGSYGFIDNIHFTHMDVILLSVFLVVISIAVQFRSYRYLRLSLLILIGWQLFSLIDSYASKNGSLLSIYNVKNNSVVSVKNARSVYLTKVPASIYNFSIKPHLNSFNYADIKPAEFNVLKKDKECVLFLNKPGYWPLVNCDKITTLILANNFKLSKSDLDKFPNLATLVMDASNNNYILAKTEELSRNFGIRFYNTKHLGAYLLALK